MAYVVARRDGRFEIRESEQTKRGPRARTLASFRVLSDAVLAHAMARAHRPFDTQAVIASGERAGASAKANEVGGRDGKAAIGAFLNASRRMAGTTSRAVPRQMRGSPGAALLELLGFADAVQLSQPAKPAIPLAFPVLARVAGKQGASLPRATASAAAGR